MFAPIDTDNPILNGPFAPIQMECDAPDLYVEGEIPADLCGSFYRCGPNVQFAPRDQGAHHLFGGDGMVHSFHIKGGKARNNTNSSELDVFDSKCVSQGPIAVAKLSLRVPPGFHGGWRPGK